jgi:hypothetical protein
MKNYLGTPEAAENEQNKAIKVKISNDAIMTN